MLPEGPATGLPHEGFYMLFVARGRNADLMPKLYVALHAYYAYLPLLTSNFRPSTVHPSYINFSIMQPPIQKTNLDPITKTPHLTNYFCCVPRKFHFPTHYCFHFPVFQTVCNLVERAHFRDFSAIKFSFLCNKNSVYHHPPPLTSSNVIWLSVRI